VTQAREVGTRSIATADAEERLRRLEALSRLLANAKPSGAPGSLAEKLAGLRRALESLASRRRALEARLFDAATAASERAAIESELERVDAALAMHAGTLRSAFDDVPLAGLRQTISARGSDGRDEAAVLLDLLLEDEDFLARRMELFDLLVTLLSTEETSNRRRIARDPVSLTPRLAASCERAARTGAEDSASIEQEFLRAAERCESGEIADLVSEMRARKATLGAVLLVPDVLRAAVFYNASVWSVLRSRLGHERAAPSAMATAVGSSRVEAPEVSEVEPICEQPEAPPEAGSTEAPVEEPPPESAVHWAVEGLPEAVRSPAAERAPRGSGRRIVAGICAAVGVAAVVGWFALDAPPHAAWPLSAGELREVSPILRTGYRDRSQRGRVFIGTVGPEWERLPGPQRRESVDRLVGRLSRSGIREVLLYDPKQRLVVHHAEGLPRRLVL
jgi:hypothetical protein